MSLVGLSIKSIARYIACLIALLYGDINMFADTLVADRKVTKEALYATPNIISAKISPDGTKIAKVGADHLGIANLFILSAEGEPTAEEQVSFFESPEIIQFYWSADSKKVVLVKDEEGTGRLHLHGFDIASKEQYAYTQKFPESTVKLIHLSPKQNQAIIGLNNRNPHFHDLYKLDLDSGQLSLILENDSYAKFLFSDDLELILKVKVNPDGSWSVFLKDDQLFLTFTAEESFQVELLSYNASKQTVYFLDSRYSNTSQLTEKSTTFPFQEVVLGGEEACDVDDVLFYDQSPKAYATYHTQKKWHSLEPVAEKDLYFLVQKIGHNFSLVSQTQCGSYWIVSNSIPDKGTCFWLYDREHSTLKQLFSSQDATGDCYSKMYELVVHARDGKELVCYYTLPKAYDKGGVLDSPLPLVVTPHGGPFKARNRFVFDADHQWLASCGYIALSVNFRLSAGFGKEFVNAGNGEWGKKAHLDVIDAVEACIEQGLTDRGKLAIFGGSYGGYETLAALAFTPDYFTCGVAICAPSNLKSVLNSVPEFWEWTESSLSDRVMLFTKQAFIKSMGGDPTDEEGAKALVASSPLFFVDQIQAPLLLVHGQNDHVVVESESQQIFESMKAHKKDVTYLLFSNEGHRFANFANKIMYLNQAEAFLSQHLNGEYHPAESSVIERAKGKISH